MRHSLPDAAAINECRPTILRSAIKAHGCALEAFRGETRLENRCIVAFFFALADASVEKEVLR